MKQVFCIGELLIDFIILNEKTPASSTKAVGGG